MAKKEFPGQLTASKGKVRNSYIIEGGLIVADTTNRISAFDVVLPRTIPYKGQVLNQIVVHFLNATKDIVPNWLIGTPVPQISVGKYCPPYMFEMVVRGKITGSMWRAYKKGQREFWGMTLPDNLREFDELPQVLLTPTTKAKEGHDLDITAEEIVAQGIMSQDEYDQIAAYSLALFARGQEMAKACGLILVDTKYEFGKDDEGVITLIDEVHTPDSSRYIYLEGYAENLANGKPQKQLSKEFVREWLMENGFKGEPGQEVPEMTDEFVQSVSNRYIELYELIMSKKFVPYTLAEDEEGFWEHMDFTVSPYLEGLLQEE